MASSHPPTDEDLADQFQSLRRKEYGYLDNNDHTYLDYTGSGLAARSQFAAHRARLTQLAFGNPHSSSPASEAATLLVEKTRTRVLQHLNASPDEYVVIFTANATGAARLVGEAYPFSRGSKLVLTHDNHNSVNGLRQYARRAGAQTVYVPSTTPNLRVNTEDIVQALERKKWGSLSPRFASRASRCQKKGLLAYPAQSNFSGVRHPLSWVSVAQDRGYDVLLDAAAYLPTATLDLSKVKPEFVMISWYKVFGYPTGVGCLVARRDALCRLKRPWFSGGTVSAVTVGKGIEWHLMGKDEAAFEDGTVNFLSIPDVHFGLDWISGIGISKIGSMVGLRTEQFLKSLIALEHGNGVAMAKIYGPTDLDARGGTVTFNLADVDGTILDERLVGEDAALAGISLRTGCFCNPGAGEDAFGLNQLNVKRLLRQKPSSPDEALRVLGLEVSGAVRVSFGIASTEGDVEKVIAFFWETYGNRKVSVHSLPPRSGC